MAGRLLRALGKSGRMFLGAAESLQGSDAPGRLERIVDAFGYGLASHLTPPLAPPPPAASGLVPVPASPVIPKEGEPEERESPDPSPRDVPFQEGRWRRERSGSVR